MTSLHERPDRSVVGQTMPHESAALHVTGQALYTDDLVGRHRDVLHAHPVQAPHAHARVTRLDPSAAYRSAMLGTALPRLWAEQVRAEQHDVTA